MCVCVCVCACVCVCVCCLCSLCVLCVCWCILCTFCVLFCALAQNVHSCGCGCVPHILLSLIHAGHSFQLGGGITTGPACTLGQQRAPQCVGEQKFGKTPKCPQLWLWLCATYFVKPNTRRALGSTRGRYHNWSCVHTWTTARSSMCRRGNAWCAPKGLALWLWLQPTKIVWP